MPLRFREWLDVAASVAMIIAAGAVVYALVGAGDGRDRRPEPEPPYAIGELFPDVPGVPGDRATAVLWLHSRCRYCEESMPFYRRMVEKFGAQAVVAMGTEPEGELLEYLRKHGLAGITAKSVPPGLLKFTGTPAVTVVGLDRRVLGTWVGKVPPRVEDQIVATLSRLTAKRVAGIEQ